MHSYKLQEDQQSHHNLKVYKKSYAVSLEIYKISASFPTEERFGITDQLRRAATRICANIAEGYGRQLTSDADFRRFLVMAKGSAQEISVWIDYCFDLNFINNECYKRWQGEYIEISKMLFSLIKSLASRNS